MNLATNLDVVTFAVDLPFDPAHAEIAVPLLVSGVSRIEAKTGCRSCTVAKDAKEPDLVHYYEMWNDEQAFRRHVQSQEFQLVLAAMDMCCRVPQVIIGSLSSYSGISYLRELREK